MIRDDLGNELAVEKILHSSHQSHNITYKALFYRQRGLETDESTPSDPETTEGVPVVVRQVFLNHMARNVEEVCRATSVAMGVLHPNFPLLYNSSLNTSFRKELLTQSIHLSSSELGEDIVLDPASQFLFLSVIPSAYVVESFVEGCDIHSIISSKGPGGGALEEKEIAAVAFDVLRGVSYLHEQCRLAHRHITTKRLRLDKNQGRVKIVHLHECVILTERVGRLGVLEGCTMADFTSLFGTDARTSDMWSIGVCVLEMTLGVPSTSESVVFHSCLQELLSVASSLGSTSRSTPVNPPTLPSLSAHVKNPSLVDFLVCCFATLHTGKPPDYRTLLSHPFLKGQNIESLIERTRVIAGIAARAEKIPTSPPLLEESAKLIISSKIHTPEENSALCSTPRTVGFRASIVTATSTADASETSPTPLNEAIEIRDYKKTVGELNRLLAHSQLSPPLPSSTTGVEFNFSLPEKYEAILVSEEMSTMEGVGREVGNSILLDAIDETVSSLPSLLRAIRAITAEVWTEMETTNRLPYAREDFVTTVIDEQAILQSLEGLRSTVEAICAVYPYFSYTFCHAFVRQLYATPSDTEGFQTIADCFTYLSKLEASERAKEGKGEKSRQQHMLSFAEMKTEKPLTQTMPLISTESESGKPSNPVGNASSFLYNKWLKSQEKKNEPLVRVIRVWYCPVL